jgi:hypothetical protein
MGVRLSHRIGVNDLLGLGAVVMARADTHSRHPARRTNRQHPTNSDNTYWPTRSSPQPVAPWQPGLAALCDVPRDARSSTARTLVELDGTSGVTFPTYLRSPGAPGGPVAEEAQ